MHVLLVCQHELKIILLHEAEEKNMYQTEVIRGATPQYVVVPRRIRLKMMDFLDMIGDSCRSYNPDNLPDDIKKCCIFKGELITRYIIAFYTDIEPSCFMRIAEELDDLSPEEISPTGRWTGL